MHSQTGNLNRNGNWRKLVLLCCNKSTVTLGGLLEN